MFEGTYKIVNNQRRLSSLGVISAVFSFILLSLMLQWPLLQAEAEFSLFSQWVLWISPIVFPLLLSGIFFAIARKRAQANGNTTDYSYGVAYHWMVISLLPVASMVSLAEYLSMEVFPTALVHSSGLILGLLLYAGLIFSQRNKMKHSTVFMISLGIYAFVAAVQIFISVL